MDAELRTLAQTLMRGIDSYDRGMYELMAHALEGAGNTFLRMRLSKLREARSNGEMGASQEKLKELLREVKRTAPGTYEELKALAHAYNEDELARAVARAEATFPARRAPVTSNAVSGGTFQGPLIQAGTVNGGMHTYYGQSPHSGLRSVTDWPRLDAAAPIAHGVRRTRRTGDEAVLPRYVPRDGDAELDARVRKAAACGGLVLVTGEPLTGKSRTAWAAMLSNLPGTTRVLAPPPGTELRGLPPLLRGRGKERCVVWLDELEGHLGEHGLTPALLAELVHQQVPVIATMGDEEYDAHRFGGQTLGRVLVGVEPVELSSVWTEDELGRLKKGRDDRRLGDASFWCEDGRIAAFLAVGPELWDEWWRARRLNAHPHGHLLVRVAMDLARCGTDDTPIPSGMLQEACGLYEQEAARAGEESFEDALVWASGVRHGVAGMLVPGPEPDTWRAFGTLHRDAVSRPDAPPVPLGLWLRALEAVNEKRDLQALVVDCARSELEPLADGNPEVGMVLGRLYDAIGDSAFAEGWFRRSADAGGIEAAGIVGRGLAERGEIVAALPYLERAAEAGDAGARTDLVAVLAHRAMFWLGKLTEAGDEAAQRVTAELRAVIDPPPDTVKE
ncbi:MULTISPECIES: hypothetical protein [unclassified Streptomyces]|uniref:hypothetical protein n=1 Tax=unclassified Streptomyces TaxID=2593676 RepID=UPI00081ED243|nr:MULTISPECIES: hypothetical protein [unclassified Streptomyces]MYR95846.1 sel1 repeat family protein [Streptomyces sp. SID4937]SCD98358.1 hypothetical protein GA0115243_105522 [Streptomyces sp. ScaeMP-e83]